VESFNPGHLKIYFIPFLLLAKLIHRFLNRVFNKIFVFRLLSAVSMPRPCYSRDEVEKSRLLKRQENYHRHPVHTPTDCWDDAANRYTRTEEIADLMGMEREQKKIQQLEVIERRRAEAVARYKPHIGDLQPLPEGRLNRKNLSGAGYDPVNLHYDNDKRGEDLKYKDQLVEFREKVRANYLAVKTHAGFNVLTGEQTVQIKIPQFKLRNETL
jgi:hypothetical protein